MDALVGGVWEPLEDEQDEGKELDEEVKDEDGRDELVEVDGGQKVGNVTSGDGRPEYDLCHRGDFVKEDNSKEIANAKDEGEEGESKQNYVVETKGRVEKKEEPEDDIADKDKKRKQESDVVDDSPRNSFLLIFQALPLLLLLLKSQQGDEDGDEEAGEGQAYSDGVEVQEEVCGDGGGKLWPKRWKCEVSAGRQPGRRHFLSSDNQGLTCSQFSVDARNVSAYLCSKAE